MDLRCLLFCSDEGTAAPIREVLAGLGVEAEHCSEAVVAVEQVSSRPFQIVIIDWDLQPEAGMLLTAARERKASERPLTLAIVSEDLLVPKALQAGANSILRKPVVAKQAKDTLKRAHDLLRARQDSAVNATNAANAQAAAAASTGPVATSLPGYVAGGENPLRGGEFVVSGGQGPGAHFDTESEMQKSIAQASASEVDPLQELEPMAAAVRNAPQEPAQPAEEPAEDDDRPRGLEWYLKKRAGTAAAPQMAAAAAPAPASAKPELLGFDQTQAYAEPEAAHTVEAGSLARPKSARSEGAEPQGESQGEAKSEQKNEAQLFAYIDGEGQSESDAKPRFRLGRAAIGWAVALAACAIVAAPQAPWHPSIQAAWAHGHRVVHAWLNPTLVTTPQAPPSHESFGRAGDEYKLPTAEPIPDATTDPAQIRVTPVVDPTAKKPNDAAANPSASAAPADGTSPTATDPFQPPAGQAAPATENPAAPATASPANGPSGSVPAGNASSGTGSTANRPAGNGSPGNAPAVATPTGGNVAPAASAAPPAAAPPATVTYTPTAPPASATNSSIPSSLKSQMASMTPDASGNKPPEAAMSSIEPVSVPEATERQLFTDQPAVGYPANAKGQQGTVILQVLIGRDGTVQDAKFVQGSLAFARAAIDGVKQWKFKPYMMNGRPVSVVSPMTLSFKPGQ